MNTPTTLRTTSITAAREYKDLPAWQRAMALAETIYTLSEQFPAREHAGLGASLRASAVAVAASIAAGAGRNNEQGVADSYSKAQSATAELATHYALAVRLRYTHEDTAVSTMIDEISRLLVGMKHGLKVEAKDAARSERDQSKRDREYKERNERHERSERPRRDFKNDGERKPRGEWKPREDRGERKPRGEWKPREDRGERKPRGDKPYRKPYKKD